MYTWVNVIMMFIGSGAGDCATTTFGCCPDKILAAEGPNFENCEAIDPTNCTNSYFGCCSDGTTSGILK